MKSTVKSINTKIPPDTMVVKKVVTAGFIILLMNPFLKGSLHKKKQATAAEGSPIRLINGTGAVEMSWERMPAISPIPTVWIIVGRTRSIARAYIEMIVLGTTGSLGIVDFIMNPAARSMPISTRSLVFSDFDWDML
jgi:hypothetical protein